MSGCCCYPETNPDGTRNCGMVSDASMCGLGGSYDDGHECGICFFVTELATHIWAKGGSDAATELAARPGLMIAYDFRDVILRRSQLGQEVADLYHEYAPRAVKVLRRHPVLMMRALVLVTKGILLAQDMLRGHTMKGVAAGALVLDDETVNELISVTREFAAVAPDKEFDQVVSRVEALTKQFAGMRMSEVLKHLKVRKGGRS